MKKLLVQEEAMIPALFYNLKRALLPLLDDSTYTTMQAVSAAAEARGRSGKDRLPSKKQDQQKNMEENRRKRSSDSGIMGQGPGLFGQNSKLTNGHKSAGEKSNDTAVAGEEGTVGDCSPERKKTKMVAAEITDENDPMDNAEDSDSEEQRDTSVCTSSYCPPCYELA